MYLTQRPNDVIALDATTGRVFWMYRHNNANDLGVCCGSNNRGLAILGDTLFMGTLDAHLVALDTKSGRPVWKTKVGGEQGGLLDHRCAAGGEGPRHRRRRAAANTAFAASSPRSMRRPAKSCGASTRFPVRVSRATRRGRPARRTRRRYCDPEAWKHGGGSVWVTGSYDPAAESDVLGHRQRGTRLQRRSASRRQPLYRIGRRARRRHRQAAVALPVHAARSRMTTTRCRFRCWPTSRGRARR